MQVANPIYDVVFKYLLDDQKVAKLLLIEIQKAQNASDIMRFRRYLGTQYASRENTFKDECGDTKALPIVTIYFLGEGLDRIDAPNLLRGDRLDALDGFQTINNSEEARPMSPLTPAKKASKACLFGHKANSCDPPVVRISRTYHDQATRVQIEDRDDFVESLTHAISEQQVRDTMDVEDELLNWMLAQERKLEDKDKELEEKAKALTEERQRSEAQAKALMEERQRSEAQARALEDQTRLIEELKRKLEAL